MALKTDLPGPETWWHSQPTLGQLFAYREPLGRGVGQPCPGVSYRARREGVYGRLGSPGNRL